MPIVTVNNTGWAGGQHEVIEIHCAEGFNRVRVLVEPGQTDGLVGAISVDAPHTTLSIASARELRDYLTDKLRHYAEE